MFIHSTKMAATIHLIQPLVLLCIITVITYTDLINCKPIERSTTDDCYGTDCFIDLDSNDNFHNTQLLENITGAVVPTLPLVIDLLQNIAYTHKNVTAVASIHKQDEIINLLQNQWETQNETAVTQQQIANSQEEMTNTLSDIAITQSQMVATQSQMASAMNQMVSLLQRQDQRLENVTSTMTSMIDQQNTQNQILSVMGDSMQKLISLQKLQLDMPDMRQPPSTTQPTTQDRIDMHDYTTQPTAQDCEDILNQGYNENYGIYTITPPDNLVSFQVSCDLQTEGGGWIVFQRRFDGSVDFYRGWEDYKNGFSDLNGEHWLGLENVHRLTSSNEVWQLRIELEDFSGNTAYAQYDNFVIGDETTYYRLGLGAYSGTAGDSLAYNANDAFSTYDQDHDTSRGNCAKGRHSAWWFGYCTASSLNGLYIGSPGINFQGMMWYKWKNGWQVLKKTEMKMRRM